MITIRQKFLDFELEAGVSREKGKEFQMVSSADLRKGGKSCNWQKGEEVLHA
jgi:hypothetical protein